MAFSNVHRLFCPSGMEAVLLDTGAALTGVRVPDRQGRFADVALPLNGPDDPSCAGMTLAPYAGRIPGGRLTIDGQPFQLSLNEGGNQLHGGRGALCRKPWRCEGETQGAGYQAVSFCAEAEDGLDGYPGNRRFTAVYRLWEDQRLEILLTAQTDRPTRVNLSNHAYFNLSGDLSTSISDHLLALCAEEVYLNDAAFLVSGRARACAPLDFRQARAIGAPHGHPQLESARGLNHCYILRARGSAPAATLIHPGSGRRMRLYTDQPCLMVYSGGFLPAPNGAIALEAQEHPISPFAPQTPVLRPGELYSRRIVYRFDTVASPTA